MSQYAAVPKQNDVVPSFVVSEGGPYKRIRAMYNKEKKTFEYKEVEVPETWILKFPKGHSIRVFSMAEVERLVGNPEEVELVNLETSDVHGRIQQPIKKKGRD